MRSVAAIAAALLLASCASAPTHPEAFSFAVLGDAPYTPAEEAPYRAMLARIDAEPVAFAIHIGDIVGGTGQCSDALYARRKAEFDALVHPLIYTPGDNEWTDCRRDGGDPLERLAALRKLFFADRYAFGRERLELSAQDRCLDAGCPCPAHPENRFWTRAGVRFVTLHIVGSDNNVGSGVDNDAEARCRDAANAAWLEQAIRASERSQTRGMVIAIQANPWSSKKPVHRRFLAQVAEAQRRIRKPVLLVHGDTHTQRIDQPFKDTLGNVLPGITRLETFGSPVVGYVVVQVDPDDPELFRFTPKLQAIVPPT